MVHLPSTFVYLIATVVITQALPLGEIPSSNNNAIYKRHKEVTPPQPIPAGKDLPPDDQIRLCIFNYVLENAGKDDDEQLDYKDLIDGCKEAIYTPPTKDAQPAVLLPGPALLPIPASPDDNHSVWFNSPNAPPLTDVACHSYECYG